MTNRSHDRTLGEWNNYKICLPQISHSRSLVRNELEDCCNLHQFARNKKHPSKWEGKYNFNDVQHEEQSRNISMNWIMKPIKHMRVSRGSSLDSNYVSPNNSDESLSGGLNHFKKKLYQNQNKILSGRVQAVQQIHQTYLGPHHSKKFQQFFVNKPHSQEVVTVKKRFAMKKNHQPSRPQINSNESTSSSDKFEYTIDKTQNNRFPKNCITNDRKEQNNLHSHSKKKMPKNNNSSEHEFFRISAQLKDKSSEVEVRNRTTINHAAHGRKQYSKLNLKPTMEKHSKSLKVSEKTFGEKQKSVQIGTLTNILLDEETSTDSFEKCDVQDSDSSFHTDNMLFNFQSNEGVEAVSNRMDKHDEKHNEDPLHSNNSHNNMALVASDIDQLQEIDNPCNEDLISGSGQTNMQINPNTVKSLRPSGGMLYRHMDTAVSSIASNSCTVSFYTPIPIRFSKAGRK